MRIALLLLAVVAGCAEEDAPGSPAPDAGDSGSPSRSPGDDADGPEAGQRPRSNGDAQPGDDVDPGEDAEQPGSSPEAGPLDAAVEAAAPGEAAGTFVAIGYGGRRMRSTDDGRTWTDDQSLESNGSDDNDLLRTVAFGDGVFLAAGWQTLSSPDGKTWTPRPATHQNWFGALVHAGAESIAVGGYGMRLSSSDGSAWTDHSVDTTAAHPHGCLAYAPPPAAGFVACNDDGKRSYSSDGVAWAYATGALDVTSSQLAAADGVTVGIDGKEVVVSHDAGQTWSHAATLDTAGAGLIFAQGRFTYLATDAVFTSVDGSSWQKHAATGARPSALAYGHGTYVAVRAHDWQQSTDGVAWSAPAHDAATDNAFEWVAFGPGR